MRKVTIDKLGKEYSVIVSTIHGSDYCWGFGFTPEEAKTAALQTAAAISGMIGAATYTEETRGGMLDKMIEADNESKGI